MATSTNSRLAGMNLRQRKPLVLEGSHSSETSIPVIEPSHARTNDSEGLKLTLPEAPAYEPTNSFTSSRTQMRMLKVKIDRGANNPERTSMSKYRLNVDLEAGSNGFTSAQLGIAEMNHTFKPKPQEKKLQPSVSELGEVRPPVLYRPPLPQQSGLKLVLPDEPGLIIKEQRKSVMMNPVGQPSKQSIGRRILISEEKRGDSRERRINIQKPVEKKEQIAPVPAPISQPTAPKIDEIPIQPKQDAARKSSMENIEIENENDLVECPEGCGRKFNRKALQTHAKACKIVFMSKRKEFNSQAKRIDNKEQANLVKQAKQKEKKEQFGTAKFEKTGEAWKTQSEGFRAVVKALKQEEVKAGEDEEIKVVSCEYCEKKFNELIYAKHLLICEAKKEKEKKLAKKTSKKQ